MGNRMGHARKLKPVDDASASGPREALDLSIADPADSQILEGQAVLDILESDPGAPPDQPISDGRNDKDRFEITDSFVRYDYLTSTIELLETLTQLERDIEEPEAFGATSGIDKRNETDSAGKDAGNDDATSRIQVIRARAMLEEITKGTTGRRRYQPPRVSWTQRVLSWFKTS